MQRWRLVFANGKKTITIPHFTWTRKQVGIWKALEFEVQAELEDGSWEPIWNHKPRDLCNCGRPYNKFRFRDTFMNNPKTKEECIAWLKKPVLCEVCFYAKELARGDWAPKAVRKELGLEN